VNSDWIAYASQHLRYNDIDNAFLATNRVEIVVGMMKKFRVSLAQAKSATAISIRKHTKRLIQRGGNMKWGDTLFDRRMHTFCATAPRKEKPMQYPNGAKVGYTSERDELIVRAQMLQDRGISLSEEALAEICALKTFDELTSAIDALVYEIQNR
jgi:hypothetical protein